MSDKPILFTGAMVRAILDGRKTVTRRLLGIQPPASWKPQVGPYHPIIIDRHGDEQPGPESFGVSDEQWGCKLRWEPGGRLWVREAWRTTGDGGRANNLPPRKLQPYPVWFEADGTAPECQNVGKLRPSIFMPRWASRITLDVKAVRVERLQDISEADAVAESGGLSPADRHAGHDPRWILGRCRDCRYWDVNVMPNGSKRLNCPYNMHGEQPDPQYGDSGQGCSHGFELSDGADETARFRYRCLWDKINGAGSWAANPWVVAIEFQRVTP